MNTGTAYTAKHIQKGLTLLDYYMIVLLTAKFTWSFLGKLYAKTLIDEYISREWAK